jgi:DNA-directed RNA polymerase specialized sigma24 family protein
VDTDIRAWLNRIASGDAAALGLLYDALAARVFNYAHTLTRQREMAEDVTHDVFLRINAEAARIAQAKNPAAYIMAMARNHTCTMMKRDSRMAALDPAVAAPESPYGKTVINDAFAALPAIHAENRAWRAERRVSTGATVPWEPTIYGELIREIQLRASSMIRQFTHMEGTMGRYGEEITITPSISIITSDSSAAWHINRFNSWEAAGAAVPFPLAQPQYLPDEMILSITDHRRGDGLSLYQVSAMMNNIWFTQTYTGPGASFIINTRYPIEMVRVGDAEAAYYTLSPREFVPNGTIRLTWALEEHVSYRILDILPLLPGMILERGTVKPYYGDVVLIYESAHPNPNGIIFMQQPAAGAQRALWPNDAHIGTLVIGGITANSVVFREHFASGGEERQLVALEWEWNGMRYTLYSSEAVHEPEALSLARLAHLAQAIMAVP